MARIKFTRIENSEQINNVDFVDGQLIACGDGKLFLDYNEERVNCGGINLEEILKLIGNLDELNTTDKTNLVNAINEISKRGDYIIATLSEQQKITSTGMYEHLKLKNLYKQVGNSLSIDNDGYIVVGERVKNVRIYGQAYFFTGTVNADKNVQISVNNEIVTRHPDYTTQQYKTFATTPIIKQVKTGDKISFDFAGSANDTIQNYTHSTYLCVEVIS